MSISPILLAIIERTAYFTHGIEREIPSAVIVSNRSSANGQVVWGFVAVDWCGVRRGLLVTLDCSLSRFDQIVANLNRHLHR